MKKIGEFFKKHKKLAIFLIVLIVIVSLITLFVIRVKKATQALLDATASDIEKVELRSLVDSLAATGTIVSIDSSDVIAKVNNVEVLEVKVEVGDRVKKGDVICVLDSEDLERSLSNLQTTQEVTGAKSDANVAIANRGLSESQETEAIQVDRDFEDADDLYEKYQEALRDVDQAKAEYDTAVDFYNFRVKEYEDYRAQYGDLDEFQFLNKTERGSYYKSNMTQAESDMNSKKTALKNKEDQADSALNNYDTLLRNYEDHVRNNDSTIMSKNDSLKNAKLDDKTANLSNEQQIIQYEDQIAECTVLATADGIITSVGVTEGSVYTGSVIATIEDDSELEISSQIDEYDIAKLREGQKVVIKTNGTGDLELDGEIKSIAPRATKASGTNASNAVTYKVMITILEDCDDLKMDMTAKLSIILDERDNILSVPYDAVQTDEDGRLYIEKASAVDLANNSDTKLSNKEMQDALVEMSTGDTSNRIYVTKGIESDYYVEVIGEGITEGLEIVVPKDNSMSDFMSMLQSEGQMGGF